MLLEYLNSDFAVLAIVSLDLQLVVAPPCSSYSASFQLFLSRDVRLYLVFRELFLHRGGGGVDDDPASKLLRENIARQQ